MRLRAVLPAALTVLLGVTLAPPLTGIAAADGVPGAAPPAARAAEPRLRIPDGWPFAQRLSRTAGTGRLHDGASYWTDFVDDDHGAAAPGGFTAENTANLAPEQGFYE